MRVLVLHSDVGPDARPDDLDTLAVAEYVARAARENGHQAELAPFALAHDHLARQLGEADVVFNLVESVLGTDSLAAAAPALLAARGVWLD